MERRHRRIEELCECDNDGSVVADEEFLKRKECEEADEELRWKREQQREQREQMKLRSKYLSKHCRK